jgi:hypothetical protein
VYDTLSGQWVGGYYMKKGYLQEGDATVTFWQDGNFGGSRLTLGFNHAMFNNDGIGFPPGAADGSFPDLSGFDRGLAKWNGTISSFSWRNDMKVEVWGQTNFEGDKFVLGQDDVRNDWVRSVKIYQYFDETYTIMEPIVDWDMHWKSKWSDIYDTRSRYFYQWVSLSQDIYGKRPRYETVTVDAKVVQSKFITKWGSEEILTPQTVLKPARVQST